MKHKINKKRINLIQKKEVFHAPCFMFHEKGVTLILAVIILSNIMIIALAVGVFSINQFKIAAAARDSTHAIFGATSGMERALYQVRKGGNCSQIPLNNPGTYLSNGSFYEVNISSAPCGLTPTVLTSTGTYRQTIRKVEANW